MRALTPRPTSGDLSTLEITPRGSASSRALEMGAYLQITPALKTKLRYREVRGCYLGPLGRTDKRVATSESGETFTCEIDLFDAERDQYPYPDGHFDTVLCCELFEHLSKDPMYLLAEVNRILKMSGSLVLSTPNTASLRSVAAVLQREHPGLYPEFITPRNGADVDPRHAREYTPSEIARVLEAGGFAIEHLETGPYGSSEPEGYEWAHHILRSHKLPLDLRGDTIHALSRKCGPVRDRFPSWLYV